MLRRKRLIPLILLAFIITVDVAGYILIEGVSLMDSVYMTLISITTVGYGEVFPLSQTGRLFTLFVIISGLGIFLYFAGQLAEDTIERRVRTILGRRKIKRMAQYKNHIVVAGFGRMGEHVCRALAEKKKRFIIIENDPQRFAAAEEANYEVLLGDASRMEILEQASLSNASAFISLLSSDADNIFTVMSAREKKEDLFIITRAIDSENSSKLYRIGANRVISPYELSSRRIVNTVLKPNVVELIDIMTYSQNIALSLEEYSITENASFAGKTIKNSGLKERYNIMIIAIKRGEKTHFNPSPDMVLEPNDLLILVGERKKLLDLQ